MLAQFLGEEEFSLGDEVLGEVAMAEEVKEQWVMKFDGSSTTQSGGVGVVLYHEEDEVVALSFKLEFPCSNNTAEYEAYLTGLATALEMGVKHLKVLGDSNLVVCQTKGSFSLKEPNLEHAPRKWKKGFNFRNRARSKKRKSVCRRVGCTRLTNNVRRG